MAKIFPKLKLRKRFTPLGNKHSTGFTLVEILIAFTIFSTLLTLAFGISLYVFRIQQKAIILATTQQNAKFISEQIKRDSENVGEATVTDGETLDTLTVDPAGSNIVFSVDGSDNLQRNGIILNSNDVRITQFNIEDTNDGTYKIIRIDLTVEQRTSSTDPYEQDQTELVISVFLKGGASVCQ